MRRFQKKPELTLAVIPGVGRVAAGQVLEGDQYARFVPSLLVEIPALPTAPPAPTAPPEVKAPPVLVPPPPEPSPVPKTMEDAGFVSPEVLVAAVDAENKQTQVQIDQAVARLDPVGEQTDVAPEEPKKKEAPKPKPTAGKKPSGRK
jgi:hypothetical protein